MTSPAIEEVDADGTHLQVFASHGLRAVALVTLPVVISSGCLEPRHATDASLHLVTDVPTWPGTDRLIVNAVIEIAAGTREKWEVDESTGKLRWTLENGKPRVIAYTFPYLANYGMVPQTEMSKESGGDGDPLDIVVLGAPAKRGEIIPAKVIGVMRMLDGGERDDKLIAVRPDDRRLGRFATVQDLERENPGTLSILETWFANY
jgi:inorganic pyrophosphatase